MCERFQFINQAGGGFAAACHPLRPGGWPARRAVARSLSVKPTARCARTCLYGSIRRPLATGRRSLELDGRWRRRISGRSRRRHRRTNNSSCSTATACGRPGPKRRPPRRAQGSPGRRQINRVHVHLAQPLLERAEVGTIGLSIGLFEHILDRSWLLIAHY